MKVDEGFLAHMLWFIVDHEGNDGNRWGNGNYHLSCCVLKRLKSAPWLHVVYKRKQTDGVPGCLKVPQLVKFLILAPVMIS